MTKFDPFGKYFSAIKNDSFGFVSQHFKLILICGLVLSILDAASLTPFMTAQSQQGKQVTLTAIVAEPKDRWDTLFANALVKLREKHPDMTINIDSRILPYADTRKQILTSMAGKTPIDIVSVDQIWLGEFAEAGFLSDLSSLAHAWNRSSEWYKTNWDGGIYNDKVYGIWAWTDVRSIWYWKDLLNQTGVDPSSLKTWDGYIDSAKKLNSALGQQGIHGVELVGGPGSQNEWYPFLWMQGGDILQIKSGHPTKGSYWFPTYNSTEGVKALEFFRQLVDNANVKPITINFEKEFASKKYA